ncbi:MAG TPA: GNAT family N-acetyltransferase [Terricaulis sp.]|nr:GNAT family N-acetyltransferase [Terricaulis sp.]
MSHPLDNPIWNALNSRQAQCGSTVAAARRFREDISPFAAARDGSAEAVAALAALARIDDDMSLLEPDPPAPPPGIALKMSAAGVQMVARAFSATQQAPLAFDTLNDADAPEMLALALLTKPGPFRAATHTLGRFIGVRENGKLIAMAGERLQMDGFVEISAVCTHPDHRGRGLAGALMRAVGDRILSEGDTPFLHAYASNTNAIALYERLGFEHRTSVTHAVWTRG